VKSLRTTVSISTIKQKSEATNGNPYAITGRPTLAKAFEAKIKEIKIVKTCFQYTIIKAV